MKQTGGHTFINSLRLRNDLYCVEWHVKLYYTIPFTNSWFLIATNSTHSTNSFPNTISTGQSVNILILYHLNGELALDSQKKSDVPSLQESKWMKQEAQLMLTNPRNAFRGQSRSQNTVPLHMLGTVSSFATVTLSLSCFFRHSTSKNVVTLKSRSAVTEGKWYHSIDCTISY